MFIPVGGYSFRVCRKPAVAQTTLSRRNHNSNKKKKKSADEELNDEQKLIYDALLAVFEVRKLLEEYQQLFHQLRSVLHKALDLKFSDNDRRLMNKRYQGALNQIDGFIKDTTCREIPLFRCSKEVPGLVLPLNLSGDESLTINLNGLDLDTLRLRNTRIDSIVYARKVEKLIKDAEAKLAQTFSYLNSKDGILDLRRVSLKMPIPDFYESSSGEASDDYEDQVEESFENRTPQLLELKTRQERAAKAKGRNFALLVNTRA